MNPSKSRLVKVRGKTRPQLLLLAARSARKVLSARRSDAGRVEQRRARCPGSPFRGGCAVRFRDGFQRRSRLVKVDQGSGQDPTVAPPPGRSLREGCCRRDADNDGRDARAPHPQAVTQADSGRVFQRRSRSIKVDQGRPECDGRSCGGANVGKCKLETADGKFSSRNRLQRIGLPLHSRSLFPRSWRGPMTVPGWERQPRKPVESYE